MKSATRDLTSGSILKAILFFAIPLFFGMLLQQFYNLFDSIIVGRVLGEDALAGVGTTSSINFLIIGFCNGAAAGAAIPVAQCFGAKDEHGLRRFVANTLYFGLAFVGALTLASCLLCRQILQWMGTLPDLFGYAYDYIFIIFLGIPTTFAYNALSGILRSLGDSKDPLIILFVSIGVNIGLDFLFLLAFRLGVSGAAWATVISQFLSALLCFIMMKARFPILKMQKGDWSFSWRRIGRLASIGLPMGLQYSITAIGSIINVAAVNSLNSTAYVAAMTSASKISSFIATPIEALGSTSATFAGQNLGAKKFDRIKKGILTATLLGFLYSALIAAAVYFFGRNGARLFLDNPTEETLSSSYQMLLISTCFYVLVVIVDVFRFAIQGLGHSMVAIIAGVMEMVGRIITALFLVPAFGFLGATFASPIAWILADAFLVPCFFLTLKKTRLRYEGSETAKENGEVH